jgi:hypothetical protein
MVPAWWLPSSPLRKKVEGAASPVFLEAVEDGKDNPVDAMDISEGP